MYNAGAMQYQVFVEQYNNHFGRFTDAPTFDDLPERIAEYRRQLNNPQQREAKER